MTHTSSSSKQSPHRKGAPKARVRSFPRPRSVIQSLGPTIIVLSLGIGSGEFILWPYLTVHHGFGILWGALLGITLQLILVLEIKRYTVVTGENIIQGFVRLNKLFAPWLILSTVIGFGWPGFASMSASLITNVRFIHISPTPHNRLWIASIIIIMSAGFLLSGRHLYKKIKTLFDILLPTSFLIILYIFLRSFDMSLFVELLKGVFGVGETYNFIPNGLAIGTFLGALAYSGSGGNFLLNNSFFSIDENEGMAKYAHKIELWDNSAKNSEPKIIHTPMDQNSIDNFAKLRRQQLFVNTSVFWGIGLLTILMLAYIARANLSGDSPLPHGFHFLVNEADVIGIHIGHIWGILFILVGFVHLTAIQIGIFDLTGRIVAYVLLALRGFIVYEQQSSKAEQHSFPPTGYAGTGMVPKHSRTWPARIFRGFPGNQSVSRALVRAIVRTKVGTVYIATVLVIAVIGISILFAGLTEPVMLIIIGAVLNALAMGVIALVVWRINSTSLPAPYRPSLFTRLMLLFAAMVYIGLLGATVA